MKTLLAFVVGCAVGAVVICVAGQPLSPTTGKLPLRYAAAVGPSYEDKYVGGIIDQVHFALMLQSVCPELVPDWLESQIAEYATELQGALRSNVLSDDALLMINAYYQRNRMTIPMEISIVRTGELRRIKEEDLNARLAKLDHYKISSNPKSPAKLQLPVE